MLGIELDGSSFICMLWFSVCVSRKRFRSKHSHYKDGHSYVTSGEFSLDPIKDHSLLEQDEENGQ